MGLRRLLTRRPSAALGRSAAGARRRVLTARRCQALIVRLQAVEELPGSLQLLLKRLSRGLAAKGKQHINEEAGTSILGKAVRGVEGALRERRSEAQARVDGAEREREARAAAQAEAESKLCDLRQAVADKKAALAGAARAIEELRAAVTSARAAQKSAEAEVKAGEVRRKQLEAVEKESYEPLKEMPAGGSAGQKRLATLRKFGRDHNFHRELLTVLPAILKKQPDKRRSFDGLALQQLEVEFARRAAALESTVRDGELAVAERAGDLEAAQAALREARERQRTEARELAAAEAAMAAGREAVAEARRHLQRFPRDMKHAGRQLALAEARVAKFEKGPMATFQRAVPPQEEPKVASSPAEIEEPVAEPLGEEDEMEDAEEEDEMEEEMEEERQPE